MTLQTPGRQAAILLPDPRVPGECHVDRTATPLLLASLRDLSLSELSTAPTIDAVFDDLEFVLGEGTDVTRTDIRALAQRLHAVFRRLVHLCQSAGSGARQKKLAASSGLLTELMPQDFPGALGYLRRLALAVSGLLDELLEDMP
jgi:hypothetical protein